MVVFVVTTQKNYQLRGGIADANWFPLVEDGEPTLGNPASNGYVLSSTTAGVRSWISVVTGTPWTGMGYVTGTPWTGMGYVTGTPWTGMGYLTSLGTALVDADFTNNGIMTRTGAGTYGYITDNSATWNALVTFPGFGTTHTTAAYGDHAHTGTYEPVLGNPGTNGWVLSSTTTGVRSWVAQSSYTLPST